MKKIFSIFFLSLFIFNIAGVYPLFRIFQDEIKKEMCELREHETSRQQIQIITLPSSTENDIEWTEGEKEFRYKGEMYDLVRAEKKGESLLLYCISDKKETNLIAQLNLNIETSSAGSSDNNASKNILKIFTQEYVAPSIFSFHSYVSLTLLGEHFISDLYQYSFVSHNSPPPKSV